MQLAEFKAWFDGFTESMEGRPTDKQWKRIKEQVKKIDGTPVTYPVYIDRYWRHWGLPYYTAYSLSAGDVNNNLLATSTSTSEAHAAAARNFDSVTAMYAAGKAEALGVHDNGV